MEERMLDLGADWRLRSEYWELFLSDHVLSFGKVAMTG